MHIAWHDCHKTVNLSNIHYRIFLKRSFLFLYCILHRFIYYSTYIDYTVSSKVKSIHKSMKDDKSHYMEGLLIKT